MRVKGLPFKDALIVLKLKYHDTTPKYNKNKTK